MSIVPPTPFILSKIKYILRDKIQDPQLLENILQKVGPFWEFKLEATYRDQKSGNEKPILECEILELLNITINLEDDIDKVLIHFRDLKTAFDRKYINNPDQCWVRLFLSGRTPEMVDSEGKQQWNQLFSQEAYFKGDQRLKIVPISGTKLNSIPEHKEYVEQKSGKDEASS